MDRLEKCRAFFNMSTQEKWSFVKACFGLIYFEIKLRRNGLRAVANKHLRSAGDDCEIPDISAACLNSVKRKAQIVNWAAKLLPLNVKCLGRSIYLKFLLNREEIPSVLVVGLKKPGCTFEAHAWVEVNGVVINDTKDAIAEFHRVELHEFSR